MLAFLKTSPWLSSSLTFRAFVLWGRTRTPCPKSCSWTSTAHYHKNCFTSPASANLQVDAVIRSLMGRAWSCVWLGADLEPLGTLLDDPKTCRSGTLLGPWCSHGFAETPHTESESRLGLRKSAEPGPGARSTQHKWEQQQSERCWETSRAARQRWNLKLRTFLLNQGQVAPSDQKD